MGGAVANGFGGAIAGALGDRGERGDVRVGDLFTPLHLIILLVIVLVIFGPKRLPELGSGLGKAIRGFREANAKEPDKAVIDTAAQNPQRPPADRGDSNAV